MMLLTYGHGTDSAERTAAILTGADVSELVGIRTALDSRRYPQFARATFEHIDRTVASPDGPTCQCNLAPACQL